jgi:DNA-directed RNA polymerase sigma subunit (sigma70/sigma32)
MGETCALDVADRGDHMLEEIANVLGCTREAIRLVEAKALVRFLRKATDVPWER